MLPHTSRLTHATDFSSAVRRGVRASSRHLVVHALLTETGESDDVGPRVGFVVSKAIGNAVRRNEVKRRLRHLMSARLDRVPSGLIVVRALPAAAGSSSAELARSLDRCLGRVNA